MPKPTNNGKRPRINKDRKDSSERRSAKPFDKFRTSEKSKSPFKKNDFSKRNSSKPGEPREEKRNSERRSDRAASGRKNTTESSRGEKNFRDKRSDDYGKDKYARRPSSDKDSGRDREKPSFSRNDKPAFKRSDKKFSEKKHEDGSKPKHRVSKRSFAPTKDKTQTPDSEKSFVKRVKYEEFEEGKSFQKATSDKYQKNTRKPAPKNLPANDGLIRLNKYLSNAGVASRREADNLIVSGAVKVNGVVVDQLGYKINPTDKVTYGGESVRGERKVYLLLNKPKDYITTLDDPQERKTVMLLIAGACRERIYPVGRLDRNTTGLLLFTNDGELTTKLTHPKYGVKKIYHVSLNKGLKPEDFKSIMDGIELEDGFIKADDLAFVGEGKKEIGIEIHSGRNRIVRRLFEHLGYDVIKLDRVAFAGLTKKDLPRGKHRFLTAKEISFLQMIG